MREHDSLGHARGPGREGQHAYVVEGIHLGPVAQSFTLELVVKRFRFRFGFGLVSVFSRILQQSVTGLDYGQNRNR